jgi:hypothetical protein
VLATIGLLTVASAIVLVALVMWGSLAHRIRRAGRTLATRGEVAEAPTPGPADIHPGGDVPFPIGARVFVGADQWPGAVVGQVWHAGRCRYEVQLDIGGVLLVDADRLGLAVPAIPGETIYSRDSWTTIAGTDAEWLSQISRAQREWEQYERTGRLPWPTN